MLAKLFLHCLQIVDLFRQVNITHLSLAYNKSNPRICQWDSNAYGVMTRKGSRKKSSFLSGPATKAFLPHPLGLLAIGTFFSSSFFRLKIAGNGF